MLMQILRTDSSEEPSRSFSISSHLALWLMASGMMTGGTGRVEWIYALLLFAAIILLPLGERLLHVQHVIPAVPPSRLTVLFFLITALLASPSSFAGVLSLFWLLHRSLTAFHAGQAWQKTRSLNPADLCLLAAAVFPAIGAMWLAAFCFGWMPFGFDGLIVLLTAAHFHHAGFTLPLIAGLISRACPGRWSSLSCGAVLAGVPLVAIGITCTHFGMLPWVEPVGVMVLVLGALGVALSQMKLGFQKGQSVWTRTAFMFSGLSLFIAMLLALGFGARYFMPSFALAMPQMWAVHGSLNAFGFGLFGLLAFSSGHLDGPKLETASASPAL
jgi:hypothetical protein